MTEKQSKMGHEVTFFSFNDKNKLPAEEKINGVHVFRPKTIELNDTFHLFANNDVSSWGSHFQFFSDVINYNISAAQSFVNQFNSDNKYSIDL